MPGIEIEFTYPNGSWKENEALFVNPPPGRYQHSINWRHNEDSPLRSQVQAFAAQEPHEQTIS